MNSVPILTVSHDQSQLLISVGVGEGSSDCIHGPRSYGIGGTWEEGRLALIT